MKCVWYEDINEFIKDTWQILVVHEVQNNLLMGNAVRERDGGKPNNLRLVIRDNEEKICLIGIMVLPFNLVLYEVDNIANDEATGCLIKALIKDNIEIPGVIGESELVCRFSKCYSKKIGKAYETKMKLNLMKLTKLIPPKQIRGWGRLATEKDLFYLPYWQKDFANECGIHEPTIEDSLISIQAKVNNEQIYIWEDECPVSVVASARSLEKGIGINFVYTPKWYRGKGYASQCVAEWTKLLLNRENEFCYLFADQKNPISNSIYKKIGYEQLCIFESIIYK